MEYKVLALDIDGTLTNEEKKITKKTKEKILELQEKGVRIVLASGRPEYGIYPIAKELGLDHNHGYILAFNGGKMIDCQMGEVIFEKIISKHQIKEIYQQVENEDVSILTYQNEYLITETPENLYVKKESCINKMSIKKVNDFVEYVKFPITKCLVSGKEQCLEKLERKLQSYFGNQLSIYRSEPFFLEIMPANVNKAQALEKLLKYLKYNRKMLIACGDGLNDISMIEYAGIGVAMGNAQDIVKAKADFITKTNAEDGVANAIDIFW